jgi:hypothetical protein
MTPKGKSRQASTGLLTPLPKNASKKQSKSSPTYNHKRKKLNLAIQPRSSILPRQRSQSMRRIPRIHLHIRRMLRPTINTINMFDLLIVISSQSNVPLLSLLEEVGAGSSLGVFWWVELFEAAECYCACGFGSSVLGGCGFGLFEGYFGEFSALTCFLGVRETHVASTRS